MVRNFSVVEYASQRVLTTEQLAQAYECSIKNISDNFKNNESHFEAGKHFFKLEGEILKDLRSENIGLQISPKTRTLYLWTRRGASRHCKMLGTDRAWDMFDVLEENYFNPKIFAPFVLIPKFFKGRQVITIADVAALLNISRSFVEEILYKPEANIRVEKDYLRLVGDDRAEFKEQNPSIADSVHHIIAILESGFNKICTYLQKYIPKIFSFNAIASLPKQIQLKFDNLVAVPKSNKKIHEDTVRIKKYLRAHGALMDIYEDEKLSGMQKRLKEVVNDIAVVICGESVRMGSEEYPLMKV